MKNIGKNNKSVDLFSFRSNETEAPVKNPENVARYASSSSKKVKFMDSKKEEIFNKLEKQKTKLDKLAD